MVGANGPQISTSPNPHVHNPSPLFPYRFFLSTIAGEAMSSLTVSIEIPLNASGLRRKSHTPLPGERLLRCSLSIQTPQSSLLVRYEKIVNPHIGPEVSMFLDDIDRGRLPGILDVPFVGGAHDSNLRAVKAPIDPLKIPFVDVDDMHFF